MQKDIQRQINQPILIQTKTVNSQRLLLAQQDMFLTLQDQSVFQNQTIASLNVADKDQEPEHTLLH